MSRLLAVILALGLVSCDIVPRAGPKGPTGALGAIAQNAAALQAPNAEIMDQYFEDFIASLDLRKAYGDRASEIIDQIRKTRATVAAARKPTSAVGGRRLAAVGSSVGTFSVPLFGQALADSLDPMTKESGTRESKPNPYSSTEEGPTTSTTTTLNITEIYASAGSRVTLTMHWLYKMTVRDKTSGATIVDATDDRSIVGSIDVCPDAGGSVNASLDVHSQTSSTANGAGTTRSATSGNVFVGTVDGSAVLRTVTQRLQDKSQWAAPSGDGGYDASLSASYTANASGSMLGGMDANSVAGTFNATGNAVDTVSKSVGWTLALDAYALDGAYQSAQKLWRNGRCVVVSAPDYSAETPIATSEQEKQQHDEEVTPGSVTKFSVNLRHRFGAALSQPIDAALTSGEKKLEPTRLDGPGQLSYTAPDDEDKQASAKLRSVSKRGIGTLVLAFHTVAQNLTLTITGTVTETGTTNFGPRSDLTANITIGPAQFKKQSGAPAPLWEADAPVQGTTRKVLSGIPPGYPCAVVTATESGSIHFTARQEKRGETTVWIVEPKVHRVTSISTCSGGFTTNATVGYASELAVAIARAVIPAEGGQVPVHGSTDNGAGFNIVANGTATATVTRK